MIRVVIQRKGARDFFCHAGDRSKWTNQPESASDFGDILAALVFKLLKGIDGEIAVRSVEVLDQ
jgi:hypothetical protein